jgi:hypothetical protein
LNMGPKLFYYADIIVAQATWANWNKAGPLSVMLQQAIQPPVSQAQRQPPRTERMSVSLDRKPLCLIGKNRSG